MDIRKPVKTIKSNEDEGNATKAVVLEHLLTATERGAKDLGCTGVSFVIVSMGIWMGELHSLDRTATKKLLNALATIADPKATKRSKLKAEYARQRAARVLMGAVDLEMATPGGSA